MKDAKVQKLRIESPRKRVKKVIMTVVAIAIGLAFLFPLYMLAMTSFKPNTEVLLATFWPMQPTVVPWTDQITSHDFLLSVRNSFTIATFAMCISFIFGLSAAYGMARFNFPGKNGILLTFLVTQMMPASLLLMPMFLVFSRLDWLNTFHAPALAITTGSIPFMIITLRPYFMSIPKSLDDAARIDGCNAFTTAVRIMLPIIRSGIITILVISFLHGWNDLIFSMTFNTDVSMRPLTANISRFQDQFGTLWNYIMAYGMILALPVTFAFIFLQKYIIGGLTEGAVKE